MRGAVIIIILVIWGIVGLARSMSQKKGQSQQQPQRPQQPQAAQGEKKLSFEELRQRNAELSRTPAQRAPTPPRPQPQEHRAVQRAAERTVEAKPTVRPNPDAWDVNAAAAYRKPTAYCQECGAKVYGSLTCPICGARVKKQRQEYEPYT